MGQKASAARVGATVSVSGVAAHVDAIVLAQYKTTCWGRRRKVVASFAFDNSGWESLVPDVLSNASTQDARMRLSRLTRKAPDTPVEVVCRAGGCQVIKAHLPLGDLLASLRSTQAGDQSFLHFLLATGGQKALVLCCNGVVCTADAVVSTPVTPGAEEQEEEEEEVTQQGPPPVVFLPSLSEEDAAEGVVQGSPQDASLPDAPEEKFSLEGIARQSLPQLRARVVVRGEAQPVEITLSYSHSPRGISAGNIARFASICCPGWLSATEEGVMVGCARVPSQTLAQLKGLDGTQTAWVTVKTPGGITHEVTLLLGELLEAADTSEDGQATLLFPVSGGPEGEGPSGGLFEANIDSVTPGDEDDAVLRSATPPFAVSSPWLPAEAGPHAEAEASSTGYHSVPPAPLVGPGLVTPSPRLRTAAPASGAPRYARRRLRQRQAYWGRWATLALLFYFMAGILWPLKT